MIPELVTKVFTNERMRIEMPGWCESSPARSLALLNLARIVRHSRWLKSVSDSVGCGKIDFLVAEYGEAMSVMRAIKNAIDPHNIMNPGKIFRD